MTGLAPMEPLKILTRRSTLTASGPLVEEDDESGMMGSLPCSPVKCNPLRGGNPLMHDIESLQASRRRHLVHLHIPDVPAELAGAHRLQKILQLFRLVRHSLHFHAAIREVFHPAHHLIAGRDVPHRVTEAHTLDVPGVKYLSC